MILYHECICTLSHNEVISIKFVLRLFSQSGGALPVVPENIHELDILEEKPDTFAMSANVSVEKKLKRKLEIEDDDRDHYYQAVYNDYLGCPLNFQFTFGDSGGQDWVVGRLFV